MHGTVIAQLLASPSTAGTVGTTFTIRWAGSPIKPGFNEDIQIKKPHKHFRNWVVDQTGTSETAQFIPTKKGKYKFRARVQNDDTGGVSGYSPTLTIAVV